MGAVSQLSRRPSHFCPLYQGPPLSSSATGLKRGWPRRTTSKDSCGSRAPRTLHTQGTSQPASIVKLGLRTCTWRRQPALATRGASQRPPNRTRGRLGSLWPWAWVEGAEHETQREKGEGRALGAGPRTACQQEIQIRFVRK